MENKQYEEVDVKQVKGFACKSMGSLLVIFFLN